MFLGMNKREKILNKHYHEDELLEAIRKARRTKKKKEKITNGFMRKQMKRTSLEEI